MGISWVQVPDMSRDIGFADSRLRRPRRVLFLECAARGDRDLSGQRPDASPGCVRQRSVRLTEAPPLPADASTGPSPRAPGHPSSHCERHPQRRLEHEPRRGQHVHQVQIELYAQLFADAVGDAAAGGDELLAELLPGVEVSFRLGERRGSALPLEQSGRWASSSTPQSLTGTLTLASTCARPPPTCT